MPVPKKIVDIEYDIDIEEVYEYLDEKTASKAAELLAISKETYANMGTSERHDYIYDVCHHNKETKQDILGLPDTIELPKSEEKWTEEDITNYISDKTGYCINGWKYDYEKENER